MPEFPVQFLYGPGKFRHLGERALFESIGAGYPDDTCGDVTTYGYAALFESVGPSDARAMLWDTPDTVPDSPEWLAALAWMSDAAWVVIENPDGVVEFRCYSTDTSRTSALYAKHAHDCAVLAAAHFAEFEQEFDWDFEAR